MTLKAGIIYTRSQSSCGVRDFEDGACSGAAALLFPMVGREPCPERYRPRHGTRLHPTPAGCHETPEGDSPNQHLLPEERG